MSLGGPIVAFEGSHPLPAAAPLYAQASHHAIAYPVARRSSRVANPVQRPAKAAEAGRDENESTFGLKYLSASEMLRNKHTNYDVHSNIMAV
jgi:hypothetical protein